MHYSTIRIEGSILSADILDRIEQGELGGQAPANFNFTGSVKVKDEIVRAWADAQDMWRVFSRQRERITGSGASETRRYWIVPFMGLLGYELDVSRQGEIVNGRNYAISHRVAAMGNFAVHVMGCNDSLDKKREDSGPRMSPHALVQEYINVTEHLYAIITNGLQLRLLRDSSRLVKLSFIEFDIQSMMEEEHYADFAVMYRLLHASRMPQTQENAAESLIEKYHQDALESGSRIREGLSSAVESSILGLANGLLNHPSNEELRSQIEQGIYTADEMYQHLLRVIYRLLFLMVIEERKLVYPKNTDNRKISIYYDHYSILRLRKLCEKQHVAIKGYKDYWISLRNTFKLFEHGRFGAKLGILPLAGDLFGPNSIGALAQCDIDNAIIVECLRNLSVFTNKYTGQRMRVNYASLNVEEFGSVYEGLLEYDPNITTTTGQVRFGFVRGEGRSSSGSHYTPEELVQPLIKHSLEHIIEDKLKESDRVNALLSIRICDVACGSGHILLSAARRLGIELARVRTGEDQPSPVFLRAAIRDVIRHCIYGVDKNPLAVELCKVSLWLEAHSPGEPLSFLDHHVKCGDAIVGLGHKEELKIGIADEAFKALPGDNKEVAATFRKRNKKERESKQLTLDFEQAVDNPLGDVAQQLRDFDSLPESTPEEIAAKKERYLTLTHGPNWWRLKTLADIQVGQFFIAKSVENREKLITDAEYHRYLSGMRQPVGQAVATAQASGAVKRFFHWFLEFPEVFEYGGFDYIISNPPFLGGLKVSTIFGYQALEYLYYSYPGCGGTCDLVAYFFRRAFNIMGRNGFMGLIATNTIAQGDTRTGGLDSIVRQGGDIIHAVRSVKWPGEAALEVALISIFAKHWNGRFVLNGKTSQYISTYLTADKLESSPYSLKGNSKLGFVGSFVNGIGFILDEEEANRLINADRKNSRVIQPYLTGEDINDKPDHSPSRWAVNYFDWPIEKAQLYEAPFQIVQQRVKPQRDKVNRKANRERWWLYGETRPGLYNSIAKLEKVIVVSIVTKHLAFVFSSTGKVFSHRLEVFASDSYSLFALLQSNIHECWARKYSSTLESRINYSGSTCWETFPVLHYSRLHRLEELGAKYYEWRSVLLSELNVGLTKAYNLFHSQNLVETLTKSVAKRDTLISGEMVERILCQRQMHRQMDIAVLSAYGWSDIDLAHDFYEVDYLPENDRVRYTISPEARREVLKRLLELNHQRHAEEVAAGLVDESGKLIKLKPVKSPTPTRTKKSLAIADIKADALTTDLFGGTDTSDIDYKQVSPRPGREKFIYELLPHLCEYSKGRSFRFYQNAAQLLTDLESCITILTKRNKQHEVREAFSALAEPPSFNKKDKPVWIDIKTFLQKNNFITLTGPKEIVHVVSTNLPAISEEIKRIFPYAIEAAEIIEEMDSVDSDVENDNAEEARQSFAS